MALVQHPLTLERFLYRPTLEQWLEELADGWDGPDGSSLSTDTICGVRIGVTSASYAHVDLPANRHDWYYRLARRLRLPERFRRGADRVYRDLCIARLRAELTGWRRAPRRVVGIARAHARYAALRAGARFAWTQQAKRRATAWSGGD